MTRSLLIAALLAVAAPAHGDIWERATNDASSDQFTALLQKGDDAVLSANSQSAGPSLAVRQFDLAIEAYRAAAKLKPSSPEPWFRIASAIDSFFIEGCDKSDLFRDSRIPATCELVTVNRNTKARELIEAWEAFEAVSPLDPRVNQILYRRAIIRTKQLGTTTKPDPLLRAVIKDYQALLDSKDGLSLSSDEGITGNLAETQLMLGDTERAIELYREAIKLGGGVSTIYGLAVALDRDGQGVQALGVIRSQGIEGVEQFEKQFDRGQIFFVPSGEIEYYFGLAAEAFGNFNEAAQHWKAFIQSGAHPQYQPRAKEHLDKLILRRSVQFEVPITKDLGARPVLRSPFDPIAPPPRPIRRPINKLPVTP